MRKILLATSALVAFAGVAQAADAPITVTAGGYVDFRAALFHEAQSTSLTGERRGGDFNTQYGLNFAAEGKSGSVEYGSYVLLNNKYGLGRQDLTNEIKLSQAYIWMSGKFGKVVMGDEYGASGLFVMAPVVGEGQIDGSYTFFTDPTTLAQFEPAFLYDAENNTKFTYYTPKVGNADHKVQLGVSYIPDYGSTGNNVAKYDVSVDAYRDVVETALQYTGNFAPVNVVVSPMVTFNDGGSAKNTLRTATTWGIGAQAMYAGFTLGGSYTDAGHYGTIKGADETKNQNVWTAGLKYSFDKVSLAVNYMDGEGYYDFGTGNAYIDDFSAVGLGATYTWFPGLTSAADVVFFDQDKSGTAVDNTGHVLMLSQKMAF